jgi:hypothetical protein
MAQVISMSAEDINRLPPSERTTILQLVRHLDFLGGRTSTDTFTAQYAWSATSLTIICIYKVTNDTIFYDRIVEDVWSTKHAL